jgi:hypothetical protein
VIIVDALVLCRNRVLCRVLEAIGKIWKTLGKVFAEYDTRQKELDEQYIGNDFFVEHFLSGTLPSVTRYSAKKAAVTATGNGDSAFAECFRWHSAKRHLCRVPKLDGRQR